MEEEAFFKELAKYPKVREETFQALAEPEEEEGVREQTIEQPVTQPPTPKITKEDLNGPFWDSLLKSSLQSPPPSPPQPLFYTKFQEFYVNFVNNLSEEERKTIITNAQNFEAQMDID